MSWQYDITFNKKKNLYYLNYQRFENDLLLASAKKWFKTKQDAEVWIQACQQYVCGDNTILFHQLTDAYLSCVSSIIRSNTVLNKKAIISKHILPFFEDYRICDISIDTIRDYHTHLANCSLSDSFIKTIHNQLTAILNFAVEVYGLKENPAQLVGNPGTDKHTSVSYWTIDQYMSFRKEIAALKVKSYLCAFDLLYFSAVRVGELLALTKKDIDFVNCTIAISKSRQLIEGITTLTPPKSRQSYRTITLPVFLALELADYSKEFSSQDYLFPSFTKALLARVVKEYSAKAGIDKIRLADFRHSHVLLLAQQGYDVNSIAKRIGNDAVDVAKRYSALFSDAELQIAKSLQFAYEEHL